MSAAVTLLATAARRVIDCAMRRAPLVVPAAAFVLAIIAHAHGFALASMLGAVALASFRPDATVGAVCGLAVGSIWGHPTTIERTYPTARYTGTITGDIVRTDGRSTFAFDVAGRCTLRASVDAPVSTGERLFVRGRIEPLDTARNPGEPSMRAMALDEGVCGQIAIERVLGRYAPDLADLRVWMPLVRARLSREVRAALPEPEATVLAGALWGERGTLPPDVHADFQTTGTVHVLVTAGLHLGFIAVIVSGALAVLRVPRIAASLLTMPVVYAYAVLSGWHLPAQRAAAMIAVGLLGRACGARAWSLNNLALAAIVVAASWPVAVESISFALSFSCVTAIVLLAEPIAEWCTGLRLPSRVAETLGLTLATQIGVWPLSAAVFFSVAPYALVANAIVVPLVGLTMTLGIATIVTHAVAGLNAVFVRWDDWLIATILATVHGIALAPGARLTMTPPPAWAIALYDALVIGAAIALRRKRPLAGAALVACGCIGVTLAASIHPGGTMTITMLDVGQGDGFVIRTPHGRTIIIDTGGRLERGATIDGRSPAERSAERVVIPYLRRAGVTAVDLMVLTHPHGDHVGGAAAILRMVQVGWVADSGQHYGGHAYNDALIAARMRHVAVIVPACRQRWADDEVTLTFLSACGPAFTDGTNDVNENSLVVLVQYRRLRALFMGDAGFASETRLLHQGVDLHADILKVGHHGSAYSSEKAFIMAVHPRIALVSVGRHNLFGHPAPGTLETLRIAGASVFRSDRCGAVRIVVAATLSVRSMLPCSPLAAASL